MLKEKKEQALLRITKARLLLEKELENNFITEKNIIHLLERFSLFSLTNVNGYEIDDYKRHILTDIAVSPFILCDQSQLSFNVKELLPSILKVRYDQEIDQLNRMFELGYISRNELDEELKLLKFVYYDSSEEGKQMLEADQMEGQKSKKKIHQ